MTVPAFAESPDHAVPFKSNLDALIRQIAVEEAAHHRLPLRVVLGHARDRAAVAARRRAMWRAKRETGATHQRIGAVFGREHSAVSRALRQHAHQGAPLQNPRVI